ncbi:All-trans-nonaprenyl-diphosphate synthase (geranyl-diphosphate specific) (plasmid) [Streptomyces sp. YIM 121038]|uniref:polyprenyl synthetase family protein n=1 Tax=Streptomyces sp. YIM 121038 TaxID=2136401 RepID=UPI00110FFF16|nr:polyprenyl synthetase family protein [Streptomyces sp. YIM 121038]QCX82598.1 All-trans-nonaprenyl-diphosphate synthase (geranyl-diphosphate specific) [Streptomyces sp. YIM 121038]
MTVPSLTVQPLDLGAAQTHVDEVLHDFLHLKPQAAKADGLPEDIPRQLRRFLDAGGKRLRPLLCVLGWHAAGGRGKTGPIVRTAAALELFHAFCLTHDDIMDRSATRRGQSTVHRTLATRHPDPDSRAAAWWGTCGAILAGDMALAWCEELLDSAEPPPACRTALRQVLAAMRQEVIYGQYLDLLAPLGPATDLNTALRVIRYKRAKYTVERPLHTGAVLAGADEVLLESLSRFALPLGEAFQLRDDLLGVFGNPQQTGKPVLDDLREGKHTVLLALAAQRATGAQQTLLTHLVGDPGLDETSAARIQDVLKATGARTTVESMIAARYEQALTALEGTPLPPAAIVTLRRIAALAVERAS